MNMRKQTKKQTSKTAKAKAAKTTKATKAKATRAAKATKAKATKTTKAVKKAAKKPATKKATPQPVLNYDDLRKAVLLLRAINHKFRQKILSFLQKTESASVSEIHRKLRVEQSVASQHLAILREAGVVTRERQGKFIFYSINEKRVKELASFIEQLAK